MAEVTTNFRDSSQGDLGKNLVSREYLISVYPKIADQILPKEIFYTGNSGNPIVVTSTFGTPVLFRNAGGNILRQEWKTFATKGSSYVSAGIKNNGTLWSWGYRCLGNLTSSIGVTTPIQEFTSSTNWNQICFSGDGSNNEVWASAIKTDGSLWSWGYNQYSTFGNNTSLNSTTPIREFTSSNNWKEVACNSYANVAVKTDGTLWSWGSNRNGTLGRGDLVGKFFSRGGSRTPVRIGTATDWKSVICGDISCVALKIDGSLWGWGSNLNGKVGTIPLTAISNPTQYILGPTTWTTPPNQNFPETLSTGSDTFAISGTGLLYGWGENRFGGLGNEFVTDIITTSARVNVSRSSAVREFTSSTNWKCVAAGGYHTAAIKTDGSLWSWGWNNWGALALGPSSSDTNTPVREFSSSTNWSIVSATYYHTTAIKTDGTLWSVGNNLNGQLGTNDLTSRTTFVREFTSSTNWSLVSCGYQSVSAIKTDGSLWSWGFNNNGQLGVNDTISRSTPVREFTSSNNWISVSSGRNYVSAIKAGGSLWMWGNNNFGQLGVNDTRTRSTPVQEFTSSAWIQSGAGEQSISAIKSDGTLWSWGNNNFGQLGVNDIIARSTPVRESSSSTNWKTLALSKEEHHVCAMKTDGTLWAWGSNYSGVTGLNNRTQIFTPTREHTNSTWLTMDLADYCMAIKTNGTLWRFGSVNGLLGPSFISSDSSNRSWVKVAQSSNTAYAISTDGLLYSIAINSGTSTFTTSLSGGGINLWSELFSSHSGYIYFRKTS